MKRLLVAMVFVLATVFALVLRADKRNLPTQTTSVPTDQVPEPPQSIDVPFRLFRTRNIYNFLKLDTRDGRVWQIQWSFDDPYRWEVPINPSPLTKDPRVGRFTLFPSLNIFTFLLLDQESGKEWQVNFAASKGAVRGFFEIPTATEFNR
jgi:hypothetical protein